MSIETDFADAINFLNNITNQTRVAPTKKRIDDTKKAVQDTHNFPTAVTKLEQAEAAVVYPTDGVALGLVNEAHVIVFGS